MSGTSADGIDAALVDFNGQTPRLLASHFTPYDKAIRKKIIDLCHPGENEIQRLGELDIELAHAFAISVNTLLKESGTNASTISAIGSHGQTIRHSPNSRRRYTLQIGDPNTIAAQTGITTVADFRRKDIALGGQGAPLVPAFHRDLFSSNETNRAIVNIGGIANVTLLSRNAAKEIIGFDTGPGNTLIDSWINTHQNSKYDQAGAWGQTGKIHTALLDIMLTDAYLSSPPPKSTGREHFNLLWLQEQLKKTNDNIAPVDVQATITEFTAATILNAIKQHIDTGEILICGGGTHNTYLMTRLQALSAPAFNIATTEAHGVHPDWVEAIAFAWLAAQTIQQRTSSLPSVTGANAPAILGGIYYAG
tara:strand:- start:1268 stop:2359 length:1092 start_codon:yes stop_codon:yes gene_type:complete